MDLTNLGQLGRVEEEKEVVKGFKVKLHTLSVEEQEALSGIATTTEEVLKNFPAIQIKCLVIATSSINGEALDKGQLEKTYRSLQYGVLNAVYNFYTEVSEKQLKVIDELKKN